MPENVMLQKMSSTIKTWLPIFITIGSLITGYFVFKAETKYQFELQKIEMAAMKNEIKQLSNEIAENKKDWQRNIERQIQEMREIDIKQNMRLKVLENKSLSD